MEEKATQPGAMVRRIKIGKRDFIVVRNHDGGQDTIAIDSIVAVRNNYLGAAVIDVSTMGGCIATIHTWDEIMQALKPAE